MSRTFRPIEASVLQALGAASAPVAVERLAEQIGADQSPVAGAITVLQADGLVDVAEESEDELRAGAKAAAWEAGAAPERRVARALAELGGSSTIPDLTKQAKVEQREVGEALKWLSQRKWAAKDGANLKLGDAWAKPEPAPEADERLVAHLQTNGPTLRAALEAAGLPVADALAALAKRAGIVDVRQRRRRSVSLTATGRDAVSAGISAREEVNELTTELLVSGRWKDANFRPYDVSLAAPARIPGKVHPFRRVLEATRRVFLEMGFEETESPWVEVGFWDFDALFQPQDHPARDMQDTFYVGNPGTGPLPSADLVARVKRTHETGGDTGSLGWRYQWDEELAKRTVLRTHTTAATIHSLFSKPQPPRKVFCVGPVFRRETVDYKHLPVFHQVDGIVVDEHASFATLLTLLRTFYAKMGFSRIQFRPAFFPYTEPSVEVFVWMENRKDWVEMGGAGMFRPEVTEPLGCKTPVLAWGLGLERLAMFRFGFADIREIYLANLDTLEETPLCRL